MSRIKHQYIKHQNKTPNLLPGKKLLESYWHCKHRVTSRYDKLAVIGVTQYHVQSCMIEGDRNTAKVSYFLPSRHNPFIRQKVNGTGREEEAIKIARRKRTTTAETKYFPTPKTEQELETQQLLPALGKLNTVVNVSVSSVTIKSEV